jgi:hypothetical protein
MIHNLKALGLAMAAMFAFSAMAATSASAQTNGKLTVPSPTILEGTETGAAANNSFTAFDSGVNCESTYLGTKENSEEALSSGAETATITPEYTNCVDPETGNGRTVDMNGCDYVFTTGPTTPTEATGTYGVKAKVVCPTGKSIQITGGACTVTVGGGTNNQDLTGAHLKHTTTGTHDIDLEGTFTNVHAVACGFLTTNEAELHIDVTIRGEGGTAVTITH